MNRRSKNALLLFTSDPVKEARRKRLYPDMQRGRHIYQAMLRHILSKAITARESVDFDFIIASDEKDLPNITQVFSRLGQHGEFTFLPHREAHFGAKLDDTFYQIRQLGYENIAVIGNDCLEITPAIFSETFLQLETHETIIGPAYDGGFYLLATRHYDSSLFANVEWCCKNVFQQICRNAHQLGHRLHFLSCFKDIDSGAELRQWLIEALDYPSPLALLLLAILKLPQNQPSFYHLPFLPDKLREKEIWQLPPPSFAA